jgi:hypothetical protein
MKHPLGIIFAYHENNAATRENLASFRRHNPDTPIKLISAGDQLAGSFDLRSDLVLECELDGFNPRSVWFNCDLQLYSWHRQCGGSCAAWLYVEWDTYCAQPVMNYFKYVRDFELSAAMPKFPKRDQEWPWWTERSKLPAEYFNYAAGLAPLTGMIISDALLGKIAAQQAALPCNCFCEVRIATLAKYLGVSVAANPMAGESLCWQSGVPEHVFGVLSHPVKYVVNPQK